MLKRPTERMDNISGGGVRVKFSSAQAPVIKPSSTTLSIMKFNSIKPHVKYLNTGWVCCTISSSSSLSSSHHHHLCLCLCLSLFLSLSAENNDSYIPTVAYALYLLAEDKISFETDIIQFFECSSFYLKTIPIPLYLINISSCDVSRWGKISRTESKTHQK